jgi:hypothetical protein
MTNNYEEKKLESLTQASPPGNIVVMVVVVVVVFKMSTKARSDTNSVKTLAIRHGCNSDALVIMVTHGSFGSCSRIDTRKGESFMTNLRVY